MMVIHVREWLFDIVIRGRGTWAAARSPRPAQAGRFKIELKTRVLLSRLKYERSGLPRPERDYLVKTNNAFVSSTDQLESLILAQNERWRQA